MIQFTDLSFQYSGAEHPSLTDITLHIRPGECVLLCGASGCGKTTLLRMINGLVPHYFSGEIHGEVTLQGTPVFETPAYELSEKIGTVYQNPRSQFFNIDTRSEIAFGIENMALPHDALLRRVEETTQKLKLEKLMGRDIFELSGGEKQKIAFASIYAMEPEIFLLDEPSANLDGLRTAELQRQIHLLKAQGKTIILSEHRLSYLRGLVDRVLFLENGKLVADSSAESFFSMSDAEREAKGLRSFSANALTPRPLPPKDTAPRLDVQKLATGHGTHTDLQDISFRAAPGEIIAIVGENGAGKSTLLTALSGLSAPQSGRILLQGKTSSEQQRLNSSFLVFQDVDYQLFGESVEHECQFGHKDLPRVTIYETLKSLGLEHFAYRHPATLSGGQKQRLAVAVSLLCQKDLLFFDEPSSGLDLAGMLRVAQLLRQLAAQGKTIFVVTHDLELLCAACTRIQFYADSTLKNDSALTPQSYAQLLRDLGAQKSPPA